MLQENSYSHLTKLTVAWLQPTRYTMHCHPIHILNDPALIWCREKWVYVPSQLSFQKSRSPHDQAPMPILDTITLDWPNCTNSCSPTSFFTSGTTPLLPLFKEALHCAPPLLTLITLLLPLSKTKVLLCPRIAVPAWLTPSAPIFTELLPIRKREPPEIPAENVNIVTVIITPSADECMVAAWMGARREKIAR